MSKVQELNKLAKKVTGSDPKENTIREILDYISSFFKGSSVKSTNTERAIQNITENYSGGGGGEGNAKLIVDNTTLKTISDFRIKDLVQEVNADFDTTGITNMSYLFQDCTNLKSVRLFDTSGLTNAAGMFTGCSSLESVPSFDFSNATTVSYLFSGCDSLTTIPAFNFAKVEQMADTFYCESLSDESLSNILDTLLTATSYSGEKSLGELGLNSSQKTKCKAMPQWSTLESDGWN